MRTKKTIVAVTLLTLLPNLVQAQITKGMRYDVEAGATVGNGNYTPFWLVSNKHGLSSIKKSNAYLSAGIYRMFEKDRRFTYGFGIEMAALERYSSKYVIQQAYVDLRYSFLELSVGAKERGSELKNDALSTGGMTLSAHSRPVPQARLSTAGYVPFPGTHQWLHIKGHIAYGYFTDDRFQRDFIRNKAKYSQQVIYHSKAGFLKLEHLDIPVTIEGGLEMGAQFGGKCYYTNGKMVDTPNRFLDFLRILVPMRGGEDASESDQINILGNQLGSYHLSVGYRVKECRFRGYYEHFFDDGSGMMMKYGIWRDGLTGLEVTFPKNPVISSLVMEFLYTKHQSGAFHHFSTADSPGSYTGADSYYNNGQFTGWGHWGQNLGNPMILPPIYNTNNDLSFQSNRVKGWHLGVSTNPTPEISGRLLLSFMRHWGTYSQPYPNVKSNKNALVEVCYSPLWLKHWHFTLAVALDRGDLLGRNNGGMLTIRKEGLLNGGKK